MSDFNSPKKTVQFIKGSNMSKNNEDQLKSSFKEIRQSTEKLKYPGLNQADKSKFPLKKDNGLGPSTIRQYNNITKRIYFQRRDLYVKRPMIILIFDGLLGLFKKSPVNETLLYVRKGIAEGLQKLSATFQIAIYTSMKEDYKVKFFIQALKNKKVVFDAVYRRLGEDSDYDIYDQIFLDF
jgi:hypothetical protein